MNIKKLANIGGISSITRYINMLTSNNPFLSTTATDILLTSQSSPYVNAFTWDNGVGSKYADPATLPSLYLYNYRWNPAKNAVVGGDYSNGLSGYQWSSGFGTKYSNPATAVGGSPSSFEITADGATVFVGSSASPYMSAYPFSSSTGFGTKYSNIASYTATYAPSGISVKGSDTVFFATSLAFSGVGVYAYPWSAGWGSKYADPASYPTYASDSSYNSTAAAVAYAASTSYVYPWSSGFGTKYADPVSGSFGSNVLFHTSGQAITSNTTTTPISWAWSSGFGTKHTDPVAITGASIAGNTSTFSDDGKIFGVAYTNASPYYALYSYTSANGFGFKYSVPAYSTTATNSIAFR